MAKFCPRNCYMISCIKVLSYSDNVQIPSEMISSSFQTLPEMNKDQLVSVG